MASKERHINVEIWYKLKPYLQDYAGRNVINDVWYSALKTNPSISII